MYTKKQNNALLQPNWAIAPSQMSLSYVEKMKKKMIYTFIVNCIGKALQADPKINSKQKYFTKNSNFILLVKGGKGRCLFRIAHICIQRIRNYNACSRLLF